jgi:DNA polymerase-3 subunit epsilon
MHFVAIDVETANADLSSICQIGIARFSDGALIEEWCSLVDPQDYFDEVNVSIHGIDPSTIKDQPTLPQISERIRSKMENTISVCHTSFDRIAINQAYNRFRLNPISTTWLDSARVVRRTWKDLAWKGYGLKDVCKKLGYDFKHHDALEDAKAAGFVLLAALRESKLDLDQWLYRVNQPIDPSISDNGNDVRRGGNPEGDLYGEVLVFTGALKLPRTEAADLAARAGCEVAANVTKKTTILVVGDQDVRRLAGHQKSSKHRKVEELISEGYQVKILQESDFESLVRKSTV